MNKLEKYFYNNPGKHQIHKWSHYFEIYDRHFSRYIGTNPTILEVGVDRGGSLEMWNNYFDGECTIYGVDINPACNDIQIPNTEIVVGDQSDVKFWDEFKHKVPKLDIIIEDGGHTMHQQITTFECMYDHVKDDGVYLCEDLHTSYWCESNVKADHCNPEGRITFIEYTKNFIDKLNAWHHKPVGDVSFKQKTHSVHYYDSVIVLEKRMDINQPQSLIK